MILRADVEECIMNLDSQCSLYMLNKGDFMSRYGIIIKLESIIGTYYVHLAIYNIICSTEWLHVG